MSLMLCAAAVCGDGILHEGVEMCDEGNEVDDGELDSPRPFSCREVACIWAVTC